MKIKVYGKQPYDFTNEKGIRFIGTSVYCQVLDNENWVIGLEGTKLTKISIKAETIPFSDIKINSCYEVYYDRYGKPQYLQETKE